MKLKNLFVLTFLAISSGIQAQRESVSFFLSGGIKKNNFEKVYESYSIFSNGNTYDLNLLRPIIHNTVSFSSDLRITKKISRHFQISNGFGLDMQQLNIESGLKKDPTVGSIVSYSRIRTSELIPRLKLDLSTEYLFNIKNQNNIGIGIIMGEMLKVTYNGYNYSFVGLNINLNNKFRSFFVKGTLSPYNVVIPNMKNNYGNLNAIVVGDIEYRIYDLSLGYAIKF